MRRRAPRSGLRRRRAAAASRTDGPKCCHCGEFPAPPFLVAQGCWQDAEQLQPRRRRGVAQGKKSTKESCKEACLEYGINRDGYQDVDGYWKVHMPCALLRDNMYKYNPALLHEYQKMYEDKPDLWYDGGARMCTEKGNRMGEAISAEITRIVDAIAEAEAEAEAEEQERMAEVKLGLIHGVKRQRVRELKATLQRRLGSLQRLHRVLQLTLPT